MLANFAAAPGARAERPQATAILRKQTGRDDVSFQGFELYTLRHTCLTHWAPHMDP